MCACRCIQPSLHRRAPLRNIDISIVSESPLTTYFIIISVVVKFKMRAYILITAVFLILEISASRERPYDMVQR